MKFFHPINIYKEVVKAKYNLKTLKNVQTQDLHKIQKGLWFLGLDQSNFEIGLALLDHQNDHAQHFGVFKCKKGSDKNNLLESNIL